MSDPVTPVAGTDEADRTCRICQGTDGKHDGSIHDARVADMPSLGFRDRRKITQRTGAKVRSRGEFIAGVGEVIGHYDDDSVYVQWECAPMPYGQRWYVADLELVSS